MIISNSKEMKEMYKTLSNFEINNLGLVKTCQD